LPPPHKENFFFSALDKSFINKIGRKTGFVSRSDGKIKPVNFVLSFIRLTSHGFKSYADWASELSLELKGTLTKQAVEERMNIRTENFVKELVQQQFLRAVVKNVKQKCAKKFKNIYCEDSTHLNLPEELSSHYPGNVSRGKKMAVAKIHSLYNMSKNQFAFLDIHSFRKNDQGLSLVSYNYLKKGDLIIRDLGFLVLSCLKKFAQSGICFITRKKYGIKSYNPHSGKEIILTKKLRLNGFFDQEVLIGESRQKMRMIAIQVPTHVANQRRRKAMKDRDKRLNHNAEYYFLLGFTILLTNIEKNECSATEVQELYGLRWRIETIFKSWKSIFSLQAVIPSKCSNVHRINCIIYLMLFYIQIFQQFYRKCSDGCLLQLSITKLAAFFKRHINWILGQNKIQVSHAMIQSCYYERRRNRKNAMEKYFKVVT